MKPPAPFSNLTLLALLGALSLHVAGCGHWPPIVNSAQDIARLSKSEAEVRARGLKDSDIPALARLRNLRQLDFSGGSAVMPAPITDAGLAALARLDLPDLDFLTLNYCDAITDAGLVHVGQMRTVGVLGLMGCRQITDAGLPHLLGMQRLRILDLRGCPGITDAGLEHLTRKKDWGQIWLGGCPNVSAQGVARLQAALPSVNVDKDEEEWKMHAGDRGPARN